MFKTMMKKAKPESNKDTLIICKDFDGVCEISEIETFYNKMNNIYQSPEYLKIQPDDIYGLAARRRTLEIQFSHRVEFLLRDKLDIIDSVIRINKISSHIGISINDFKNSIPELFVLKEYFKCISNNNSATDYAMAMNSIIYNSVYGNILYGIEEGVGKETRIGMLNKFMIQTMQEFISMLNVLHIEAVNIYYNAGFPGLEETLIASNNIQQGVVYDVLPGQKHIELTGQERADALIEMGQGYLIDTDVKVGRF